MNQLTTKPTSQITSSNDTLTIHVASDMKLFIQKNLTILALTSMTTLVFFGFVINNLIVIISAVPVLLILYFINWLLPSDIIITKTAIKNNRETVILSRITYLDVQAQIIDESVEVRIGEIRFRLDNVADLPILTEEIARIAHLEFYDNNQLLNKTEVLTYKARYTQKPVFNSFLVVQHSKDSLQVYDMINQLKWFKIDKTGKSLMLNYSRPTTFAREHEDVYLGTVQLNNIAKIVLTINQKAGIFKYGNQITIGLVEKTPTRKGFGLIDFVIDRLSNKKRYHYIFKSNIRNRNGELTNFRDGELIFSLLSMMTVLKNIEIEKVIIK